MCYKYKIFNDKVSAFAGISTSGGVIFFSLLNIAEVNSFGMVVNPSLFIIIYLGILTIVTYALYNFAICTLPACAVFSGRFFLGETFNLKQFAACLLVFAGIYICGINTKKKFVKTVKSFPFLNFLLFADKK